MMEVKTNVEYQAALKENETHKTEKSLIEEKVLALISDLETFRNTLKEADSEHKARSADFNGQKSRLQEEGRGIQKAYEELLEKRKGVIAQLGADTKVLYEKACSTLKGVAISKIDKGMCCSCNVRMRPQLYNEVLGFKAIHRCPSCSRILVPFIDETETGG
jgi:predicted  nucleic acid-binding Zn-ribbon protein